MEKETKSSIKLIKVFSIEDVCKSLKNEEINALFYDIGGVIKKEDAAVTSRRTPKINEIFVKLREKMPEHVGVHYGLTSTYEEVEPDKTVDFLKEMSKSYAIIACTSMPDSFCLKTDDQTYTVSCTEMVSNKLSSMGLYFQILAWPFGQLSDQSLGGGGQVLSKGILFTVTEDKEKAIEKFIVYTKTIGLWKDDKPFTVVENEEKVVDKILNWASLNEVPALIFQFSGNKEPASMSNEDFINFYEKVDNEARSLKNEETFKAFYRKYIIKS